MDQYLPQNSAAVPLIAAIAANSFFLRGNLGALITGVIPYLLDKSPPYETIQGTNWFIEKGNVSTRRTLLLTFTFPFRLDLLTKLVKSQLSLFPSGILSSALFGCTAFFASDPRVQRSR